MATTKRRKSEPADEIKNVAEALKDLEQEMAGCPDVPPKLEALDAAIERAAGEGVEALVGEVYGLMLMNAAKMLARAQYVASRLLTLWDKTIKPPQTPGPLPPALAEEWLPRIERIQNQVMKIAESGGRVMHAMTMSSGRPAAKGGSALRVVQKDEGGGAESDASEVG